MRSITPDEQISTPKALMTPKQRIRFALKRVDSDGYWASSPPASCSELSSSSRTT